MKRYSGKGIIWEFFNEPNYHFRNGAVGYATCLNAIGKAVRGDPSIVNEIIIGPATGQFNFDWINTLGKSGALSYLDAISTHPYRAGGPETVLNDWNNLRK